MLVGQTAIVNLQMSLGGVTEALTVTAETPLIETKSKDAAIDIARRFMSLAGDGEGEILQVYDPGQSPR